MSLVDMFILLFPGKLKIALMTVLKKNPQNSDSQMGRLDVNIKHMREVLGFPSRPPPKSFFPGDSSAITVGTKILLKTSLSPSAVTESTSGTGVTAEGSQLLESPDAKVGIRFLYSGFYGSDPHCFCRKTSFPNSKSLLTT